MHPVHISCVMLLCTHKYSGYIHLSQAIKRKTIERKHNRQSHKNCYNYQSSDKPECTQNRIKMHSDSMVTISPRQMSDCSATVNNNGA